MKTKFITRIFLSLILILSINEQVFSQNSFNANAVAPSASSMGLVSTVNHTTGTPNIGIPLFNLEHAGIQVQLALAYNTGGIRLEERATEVGMGWRLVTGGKITRVIQQQPDDLSIASQIWNMTAFQVAEVCYKTVATNIYKDFNAANSESDLFYYEIPGKTGMFVLDGQGKPHTIPYQNDISITVVSGTYFTINDNAGNLYTFGNASSSRESTTFVRKNENLNTAQQTESFTYTSTWHLNSIKNYNGNIVTFGYATGVTEAITSTSYVTIWTNNKPNQSTSTNWSSQAKEYPLTTTTSTKVISSITAGSKTITFTTKANLGNSIGEIIYAVSGVAVKKYRFTYESFANNRVFLSVIDEGSSLNTWQKFCSFEYNKTRLLPVYNSYDYDSWGYYNGKGNTTHLPTITNDYAPDMVNKPVGADRSPVLDYAKACMLTAIKYNTGGKVEYTYGLNKHGTTNIGGMRVEKIRYFDENNNDVYSTKYEYNNSSLGGLGILPRHVYRVNNITPYQAAPLIVSSTPFYNIFFTSGAQLLYGEITEIAPDNSKTKYTYSAPGTSPGDTYANKACLFWYYSYKPAQFESAGNWQPATVSKPVTSRFWRHGLLLNLTKYDHTGIQIEETQYTYKHDHPRKTIIKGYSPCVLKDVGGNNTYFLFEYEWESQPVLLESTSTKYFNDPASTLTTTYTYSNDDLVTLTSTTQNDAEGNSIRTTYRYAHNLTHTPIGVNFPTKNLVSKGILAPVETVTYKNNKVVSADLTEYGFVPLTTNSSAVLPTKKYDMPLQTPVNSITQANYNGTPALVYDSRYTLSQVLGYDLQGNIQNTRTPQGEMVSLVYQKDNNGYNTNVKIAETLNAIHTTGTNGRTNQVFYTSFEDLSIAGVVTATRAKTGQKVFSGTSYSIPLSDFIPGSYLMTYWKSSNSGQTWTQVTEEVTVATSTSSKVINNNGWIDEVRILPADARMKTYTYSPELRKTSEADHNGITVYWEYDSFGRVIRILDNDRQLLESYEYHIRN